MRIFQVHTRYRNPGGEDAVVAAEAALLRDAGHEVATWQTTNPWGAVTVPVLVAAAWNPIAANDVAVAARRWRADVVHVHNTWFALSPAIVKSLARSRIPVVMTLHNYRLTCANAQLFRDGAPCEDCVGSHPWHGVVHACYRGSHLASVPAAATIAVNRYRRTWTKVARFVALTEFARERFLAVGLPPDRIVVKPNPVADPGSRDAPPSSSGTVVAVGRLSQEKGFDVLVRAASALQEMGLELVVVGDGPEKSALQQLAGGAPVRFAGWLPPAEVSQLLRGARALCFPSRWYETFGLVAVEAMAAGLPVVASDLGGIPEIVGDAGWVVPPGQEDAWRAALRRLGDDSAVDARGARGRHRWRTRFSPTVGLPILEEVYREAQETTI